MKTIFIFASGNMAALAVTMISSLLAARFLEPRLMGIFNALSLSVVLAPVATLGVINGLNRQLPYLIGRGEGARVAGYADVTHLMTRWLALLSLILFSLAALAAFLLGRPQWGLGLIAFGIVVAATFYRTFVECTYRTGGDFARLTRVKLWTALLGLLLIGAMPLFPWGGMLARTVLVAVAGLLLLWRKRPIPSRPVWQRDSFLDLLRTGLPIFLVGYLFSLFSSVDRLVVGSLLGVEALGHYTPATLVLQAMAVLPMSVNQVIYPQMALRFGATGRLSSLRELAFRPLLLLLALQIPLVAAGWWLLPVVVQALLPKYLVGVEAARWALVAGALLSLMSPTMVFNVAGRQLPYGVIMAGSLLLFGLLAALLIHSGFGLVGVSWALCLANLFFVAACAVAARALMRESGGAGL